MIAPAWLPTHTQPIAIDDVLDYLRQAPSVPESAGREMQIGGPDVLSYGEMLDRMADVLGSGRRPKLPVPLLTPVALVALDRPRDAGRRGRGAAAGRGALDGDGRDRSAGRRCSTSTRAVRRGAGAAITEDDS